MQYQGCAQAQQAQSDSLAPAQMRERVQGAAETGLVAPGTASGEHERIDRQDHRGKHADEAEVPARYVARDASNVRNACHMCFLSQPLAFWALPAELMQLGAHIHPTVDCAG